MSVRATARIVAVTDARGATVLPVLESGGPLALRRTRAVGGSGARVTVVGAMSAPLGGDRLTIEARVEAGARLTVDSAAATVALPGSGPDAEPAGYAVELAVGEGAELRWLPEQLISAYGSELHMETRVELAATARLVLREEQILGRHGEGTGTFATRLTVRRAGRPLLDQQLAYGPGAPGGWDGPAVLGGHRAVGQLLVVDPYFDAAPARPRLFGDTAALTPLAGPAALLTAVAADARLLRRVLDEALDDLLKELPSPRGA
ncbi:urease accessory protein UreD [Streptomyces sp. NBC_00654]|uniref:urease accessory protein UreD n=1 Tax=Streptomyces sp. NBC_00654 TaxID=2975799 RepID=UPI002259BBC8|nr:urease accessory protein UreD [Streptomyces sp. NBC_00654]MCX4967928.1 urease accessory protein UreD [Streptomyces sp. NBC_00654]